MKKNTKRIIAVLLVLLLCSSLFSCMGKSSDNNADNQINENVEPDPDTLSISFSDLLKICNESWTFGELLTKLFPQYVIYTDQSGNLSFVDHIDGIDAPDYDFGKITKNSKGFKVYDKDNDEKQSWIGIDVSAYQDYIDWQQVSENGIDFAFIRLGYRGYSEGSFSKDAFFDYNVSQALANGIQVGVYFVTQAITDEEAVEEANYVLDAIRDYDISWPVVYDVEGHSNPAARANGNTVAQNTSQIIAFCNTIKAAGYTPMVYSNTRWFLTEMDISQLSEYDLWYAYYKDSVYFPYDYKVWQYSCTGSVPGIYGDVDLNISFKNYGK